MSAPKAGPTHTILLSDDLKFHESLERAFRAIFPTGTISRAHPEGGAQTLRSLLGGARELNRRLIIDYRHSRPSEMWRVIHKWAHEGGRAILVAETSKQMRDLMAHPDAEIDLFAHNHEWESERTSRALTAILGGDGFASFYQPPKEKLLARGEAHVTSARQKSEFLASMQEALQEAGVQRTKRSRISAVADELLMNAIYDAPSLSQRSKLFKNLGGTKRIDVQLDAGMKVRVRWALTKDRYCLTVCDPYGTLTPDVLNKRVATFLTERTVEVSRAGDAGGGVGLYMVLRSVASFSAYVVKDDFTEVSVCVELGAARTARGKWDKEIFVHFTSYEGSRPLDRRLRDVERDTLLSG